MGDETSVRRIPLRRRDGSIRAYALVDAGDYDRLNAHRWSLHETGYAVRSFRVNGKPRGERMNRAVLGERDPAVHVDHRNGVKLDNRRLNLRRLTHAANQQNRVSERPRGHRGVSWHPGRKKWQVRVKVAGVEHWGGYHDELADAVDRAREMRAELMPFSQEAQAA